MNDDDALYHRLADCLQSVLAEATVARAGEPADDIPSLEPKELP